MRRPGVVRWIVLALVLQAGLAAIDIVSADEVTAARPGELAARFVIPEKVAMAEACAAGT